VFPDKPVTKKPAETRMGKGKGAPDHWVAVVRPGKILFEMEGVSVGGCDRGHAAGIAQAAAAHDSGQARDGALKKAVSYQPSALREGGARHEKLRVLQSAES
jgi:hypothetical protein